MCYISGLTKAQIGGVFEAEGAKWWVVALFRPYVIALKLSQEFPIRDQQLTTTPSKWVVPAGNTTLGSELSTFSPTSSGVDMLKFLATKPPIRSYASTERLITGYSAIDIFSPLLLGQNIIFKGKKNAGKFEVLMNTATEFLKLPNSAVVVALVNSSRKAASVLARLGERAAVYSNKVTDSAASQALLAVTALANAVTLKDEGKRVLLIVDDIQYQFTKEQSCFSELGFPPYNFQHLAYEHTKASQFQESLTTIQVPPT